MPVQTKQNIVDNLLTRSIVTARQVNDARIESINTGRTIESILIERNFVKPTDIQQAKAAQLGIPYIKLSDVKISSTVLTLVPEQLARRYLILPFDVDSSRHTISLAMKDPLDLQLIQFLEQKTGFRITPYFSTEAEIADSIQTQYTRTLTKEVTQAIKEVGSVIEGQEVLSDLNKASEIIREAPVAKIISTVLEYAIKGRASDVHVEPLEDRTRIRYRIDGILQERLSLDRKVHDSLVSRVKILSDLRIDEKRVPQDGRFTFKLNNEIVDLRVSTLPTVFGEKVVMRLLSKSTKAPSLQQLGLRGHALKVLESNITKPHGIILITGPTGSGKTTTLYSILTQINDPKVNIVTLEDPVEYQMPGVNQVQTNPAAGLTFASGIRSFLRQDPNIIMVGEVRDSETAELAIQASLTGHLVFSTLHTNSAAGALPRLLDMKAETFLLASSMLAVVAQRVLRKICPNCSEAFQPDPVVFESIKRLLGNLIKCEGISCTLNYEGAPDHQVHQINLYKGKGCDHCGHTGYQGRIGIYEVLNVDEKIAKLILEKASADQIEQLATAEGMITMLQDGYLKVLEGVTTFEEVMRVAQE